MARQRLDRPPPPRAALQAPLASTRRAGHEPTASRTAATRSASSGRPTLSLKQEKPSRTPLAAASATSSGGAGGQRQVHRDRVGAGSARAGVRAAASEGPAPPAPTPHVPGAERRAPGARRAAPRSPRPRSRRRRARAARPRRSPPCPSSSSSRITASSRAATTPSGRHERLPERDLQAQERAPHDSRIPADSSSENTASSRPVAASARVQRRAVGASAHVPHSGGTSGSDARGASSHQLRPPAAGMAMGTRYATTSIATNSVARTPAPQPHGQRALARAAVGVQVAHVVDHQDRGGQQAHRHGQRQRLPCELLGLHVVGAGHGHQAEEEEHEQLAEALVAVGPRPARVQHARRDRHQAHHQQLRARDPRQVGAGRAPRSRTPPRCR